jgi:excisionase family DNA binding protein
MRRAVERAGHVHLERGTFSSRVARLKPLTVTISTARKLSGLGHTTIWRLIKEKRLVTVHVGRRTLIIFSSLEELLKPPSTEA